MKKAPPLVRATMFVKVEPVTSSFGIVFRVSYVAPVPDLSMCCMMPPSYIDSISEKCTEEIVICPSSSIKKAPPY